MGKTWKNVAVLALATTALVAAVPAVYARTTAAQTLPVTTKTPPPATGADTYPAPTADIGLVANAVSVKTKSVTWQVSVPAGIQLSAPVYISVGGRAPAAYSPTAGFRFVSSDHTVTDPTPRPLNLPVTLTQPSIVNTPTLTLPFTPTITPLYTVQFGPLKFTEGGCYWYGDPEVGLGWVNPDGNEHSAWFTVGGGKSHTVTQFASTWKDVGVGSPLQYPWVSFVEVPHDGFVSGVVNGLDFTKTLQDILNGSGPDTNPRYPLASALSGPDNYDSFVNASATCHAEIRYQHTHTLETFTSL